MDRYRLWTKPATKTKDTVQEKCWCTSYKSHPHIKIGCTPVRRTENSWKCLVWVSQCRSSNFTSVSGFPVLAPSLLLDTLLIDSVFFFLKKNRAYRQSFSACWWASCQSASALGLKFWLRVSLGCQMHLDQMTLKTCPQSLSASLRVMSSKKKKSKDGSLRTCHELSTFVRWLSYVDTAWLDGLRDGSLRACSSALSHSINAGIGVEPAFSCGNDVGGDVPDELDEQEVVDHPRTTIATGFTCNRRRKSACRKNPWQVFPNICRSNFGEDIADLSNDCVDVQWLLALVGGGNPSDSPRRSSWTSPRTWMVPSQCWSSQNLISSNKF